jgi:hypothetical protein
MNIALWIALGLLAAVFVFSAYTKGTWSREKLVARGQSGAKVVALWLLCPVAAAGLSIVMIGATGIHVSLREPLREPPTALRNLAPLATCVFVAIGRS